MLAQFAEHCRREGYADGSIIQEAVEGFLYGRHLKASTIRREEIILRDLAEHARQFGWPAWAPPTLTRVKTRHRPPPYVFSDEEIRRLFHAIDTQPLSEMSNRALVDPVLFRVLYATGLRISEALNLQLRDVDPARATLEVRDSKNREHRIVPVTRRLADTLEGYIAAAHPDPEPAHHLFHTGDPAKPADKSTIYNRLRRYLADADIPHFPGGPHIHSLRHGFAVQNLRRWAADGSDLAVMLPYLSAYMGHADLRGTQYYLQLTADAYPEVAAMAQARFGYVIPSPAAAGRSRAVSRVTPDRRGTGRPLAVEVPHRPPRRRAGPVPPDDRVLPRRDQTAAHLVPRRAGNPAREAAPLRPRPGAGARVPGLAARPNAATRRRPATSASP